MSVLSKPYFHDEAQAFAFVEAVIWAKGVVCPHCGGFERIYDLTKTRIGLKKCGQCRKQFTVRVGTIFEDSHLPMTKWLQAIYLMCASKKGVSALQLQRVLEVTYKTAWFLAHRIREAMVSGELGPFGMGGATVEVDETFIGNDPDAPAPKKGKSRSIKQMMKVVTLVERETGRSRSIVLDKYRVTDIQRILGENMHKDARLMTDESNMYTKMGEVFRTHETVNHSKDQYVRYDGDRYITTNTVEGFFSVFKRGMKGVYQHCGKKHLHRYLAEFDFRYSYRVALGVNDQERAVWALKGVVGKRLTYRRTDERPQA